MNINLGNPITKFAINTLQRYNHKKYWDMRKVVVNSQSRKHKLIKLFYLLRIKRMDAYNNASMGTDLGKGAYFSSPPILYHGLNGIIVSHYASIGKDCVIYQRVTIAQKNNKSATIGDNCVIGAGAVIVGSVKIGDNVKIGPNCVVTKDVPDNCVIVGNPGVIIKRDGVRISN